MESNVADFRYYHWQRWRREVERCRLTGEAFVSGDFVQDNAEPARIIRFPLERIVQLQQDPEPPGPAA